MLVMSWNVNSIKVRIEAVLAVIERLNPDVLLLQEIKCLEDGFPFATLEAKGYQARVCGQKAYNGVALVSRYPIEDVVTGLRVGDEEEARLIAGTIRGIRFLSLYVPNGQSVGAERYHYK